MRHTFPYTNFHDLNLDWILAKVNEWDALIKQKLIEISKAVTTANTASASVAVAVEQAAQANLNAETAKNTANDALTTAREGATAAAASAKAAEDAAEEAAENSGLSVTKAEAAEASATAAAASAEAAEASAGTSADRATAAEASAAAAAASAEAAKEAAEKAASGSGGGGGGYNINDIETLTNLKYINKDVYVKRLYLGYHLDVDTDLFHIPFTGIESFLKIDILVEQSYSAFTGLQPTDITPSGSANNNLTINIPEGVAEGGYYAIIYYTKA